MATRSEAETIEFLLACIQCTGTEGRIDHSEVAKLTGMYKAGKYSLQALRTIQKKYPIGGAASSAADNASKAYPKGKKKKTDDVDGKSQPKRAKKAPEPKLDEESEAGDDVTAHQEKLVDTDRESDGEHNQA